jgi:hypothetical protein
MIYLLPAAVGGGEGEDIVLLPDRASVGLRGGVHVEEGRRPGRGRAPPVLRISSPPAGHRRVAAAVARESERECFSHCSGCNTRVYPSVSKNRPKQGVLR